VLRTPNFFVFCLLLTGTVLLSCTEHYTPKPRGYFRIQLPEKNYVVYTPQCPVSIEVPSYGKIERLNTHPDSCWFNVYIPKHKARIHLTYRAVEGDVTPLLEDAYNFAFKHEMKANSIKRTHYENDSNRVFGTLYDLTGNVASPLQFYVTDSTRHFFRGALYFQHIPNADSIAPVLNFVREDVVHLIETMRWSL